MVSDSVKLAVQKSLFLADSLLLVFPQRIGISGLNGLSVRPAGAPRGRTLFKGQKAVIDKS